MTRYDGVIFDMDGTLVEALLDFDAMRRHLGAPPGRGILEHIEQLEAPDRQQAVEYLLAQEMHAASRAQLMPGARETLAELRRMGFKTALLTRNTAGAMQSIISRFDLQFDLAWSREDGPIKPEPDGILKACRSMGIRPKSTLCVGDFHYDLLAARAAGAPSVLLVCGSKPPFADQADYVIQKLTEILAIVNPRA